MATRKATSKTSSVQSPKKTIARLPKLEPGEIPADGADSALQQPNEQVIGTSVLDNAQIVSPEETSTYSICTKDGHGESFTYKFECRPDELTQEIEQVCSEFAYTEAKLVPGHPQIAISYTVYEGHYMHSADYIRFVAYALIRRERKEEKNEHAEVLENAAADIEREKAVLIVSGSTVVTISPAFMEEFAPLSA
jgi:hypothetical protein